MVTSTAATLAESGDAGDTSDSWLHFGMAAAIGILIVVVACGFIVSKCKKQSDTEVSFGIEMASLAGRGNKDGELMHGSSADGEMYGNFIMCKSPTTDSIESTCVNNAAEMNGT